MELCIVYNFSQKYREGIYSLLEKHYSCHWVFGNNNTDIEGIKSNVLSDVTYVKNISLYKQLYYQKNVIPLMRKYDNFLILGELFCISTWIILLLHLFMPNKKVFLWSHGWYGRENKIKRILKNCFFSMSDGVFLYNRYAKKIAREQGYKKDNLYVIHNSLDYDLQKRLREKGLASDIYTKHFGNDNPVILFIGRLTRIKHLDLLIESVKILRDQEQYFNIVFVGDGEERANLEQLAIKMKLEKEIWFYGKSYNEEQNAPLIYNADICVSPGNVGLTAMHSMVYGTPVLTHDDFPYQMPEFEAIKPGETGDFFKRNDSTSLTNTIKQWFSQPNYDRQKIRKECYHEIDTFWTPSYQFNIIKDLIK